MRADIKLIREELECLKGWIKHWKVDVECKLVPTDSSLIFAEHHADRALSLLDRVETEQKAPA